jgi:hypothetical protein
MSKLIDKYFQNNFYIIPIRKNSKRPLFKQWNKYSLSLMETRQYIKDGYNIAVVAKDLWILDYDIRPNWDSTFERIDWYRRYNTWVQFTPHGYHIVLRCDDPLNEEILQKFEEPETVRHNDMYALIAPSKIDGHSYWWLDSCKGEILTL